MARARHTEHGVLPTHPQRIHQPIDTLCDRRPPLLGGRTPDEPLSAQSDAHFIEKRALRERPMGCDCARSASSKTREQTRTAIREHLFHECKVDVGGHVAFAWAMEHVDDFVRLERLDMGQPTRSMPRTAEKKKRTRNELPTAFSAP